MNEWQRYRPIDAHTHLQPDALHASSFFARLGLQGNAAAASLDRAQQDAATLGVTRQLLVPWLPAQRMVDEKAHHHGDLDAATNDVLGEWHELNVWAARAAAADPEHLWALVGVDPVLSDEESLTREVESALAAGAVGLKVAPQWLNVRPDDPAMEIVWQLARRHEVPVLSESGAFRFGDALPWGHPRYFKDVLTSYSDVTIVLAHLGMGAEEDLVRLTDAFENLYTDTALRLPPAQDTTALRQVADLIRRIGVDRVMFGSNTPVGDLEGQLQSLAALPLADADKRHVARENALRVWGRRKPTPHPDPNSGSTADSSAGRSTEPTAGRRPATAAESANLTQHPDTDEEP